MIVRDKPRADTRVRPYEKGNVFAAIVFAITLQGPTGAALFEDRCAVCHAAGTDPRVPTVAALRDRTPQAIVDALTTGQRREQGADLTDAQRRALADFLTNRSFDTVNGVPAKGASINGPGPVVVGGMLYINSGYGAFGGRPGNVLLAFGLP